MKVNSKGGRFAARVADKAWLCKAELRLGARQSQPYTCDAILNQRLDLPIGSDKASKVVRPIRFLLALLKRGDWGEWANTFLLAFYEAELTEIICHESILRLHRHSLDVPLSMFSLQFTPIL